MKSVFIIIHVLFSAVLIGLILLQSSQGGLSGSISGGALYRSKRGAERIIFIATIIASLLFLLSAIANLIVG